MSDESNVIHLNEWFDAPWHLDKAVMYVHSSWGPEDLESGEAPATIIHTGGCQEYMSTVTSLGMISGDNPITANYSVYYRVRPQGFDRPLDRMAAQREVIETIAKLGDGGFTPTVQFRWIDPNTGEMAGGHWSEWKASEMPLLRWEIEYVRMWQLGPLKDKRGEFLTEPEWRAITRVQKVTLIIDNYLFVEKE